MLSAAHHFGAARGWRRVHDCRINDRWLLQDKYWDLIPLAGARRLSQLPAKQRARAQEVGLLSNSSARALRSNSALILLIVGLVVRR